MGPSIQKDGCRQRPTLSNLKRLILQFIIKNTVLLKNCEPYLLGGGGGGGGAPLDGGAGGGVFLAPPGFPADFPPPPFLGFLLGYVLGVFMKGSGGGMSLLNWNLDSNSPPTELIIASGGGGGSEFLDGPFISNSVDL